MKYTHLFFILISFVVLETNASDQVAPLTEVNVQLKWRHQFQFAGYYAAIEQGFYQKSGLKVNLLEREFGPTPIDKLISGTVDYAIGGVGALVYRVNEVPLVALAATFQHSPSILISRYPYIKELKNKKVMLSKGIMNAEITSMLQKQGVSFTELEIVPSNQSIKGFIDGQYDAYNAYTTNEIYQLDAKKIPYYTFSPRNYGIDFYGDILLTTEKKVKTDIEQVELFRAATLKGWAYAIGHVEEMVMLIHEKYNSQNKTSKQLFYEANALIKLIYSDIVPIGYMNEERWQEIGQILQSTGDIRVGEEIDTERFLFSNYIENSFFKLLRQNIIELIVFAVFLSFSFLLFHNYRLKLLVRERTKQLNKARVQAEHDARTDNLTGLANHRSFTEMMTRNLSLAKRNHLELSIIHIDIDWFKKINDHFGHAAGDKALITVADILKRNVRLSDTASRTGGEEFVIICLGINQEESIHLAERIRAEVEMQHFSYQKNIFKLTISLGVASVEGEETIEHLLKKSDDALYRSKKLGRNQVQY
ncbi:MAG: diguanylate cyclase (GGDEF)-like protein [Psychromonas sp.]